VVVAPRVTGRNGKDIAMTTTSTTPTDAGLLVLRLGVGATMAAHGTQKLFAWFDGGGLSGTEKFFAASGYPMAKSFAVVAGLSETLGGIGLILGLFTPLAAAAILGTMLNAIAVKWGGFFAPKGVEYETILAVAATASHSVAQAVSRSTGSSRGCATTSSSTAWPLLPWP